jgi:magnesium transporter
VHGIVDCAFYAEGRRRGGRVPLDVALETARSAEGGFVWIGLYEPAAEQFHEVTEQFGLPPLAVEDAVHAHQRPKLEVYDDIVFVVLKTAWYADREELVEIGELMVFIGPDFAITVRHGPASGLGHVRSSLESRPDLLELGPSAVLYAVADHVVDDYGAVIAGVADDVDDVESQVFSGGRQRVGERVYKLKREMVEFRRAVQPLLEPLDLLADGRIGPIDPRTAEHFRDVEDHAARAADAIEAYNELLSSVLQANLAQVSLRQNDDMRKITAYAAILAVNTTIAGIYGMNFQHMPELHWRLGYPLALVLMLLLSVALYRAFRRNRWL